ncbi:MAG: AAA family ATPase [Candidatus Liptonbacteria bacterium]|nr:AAA family ATPase [Candidatus Liptonbacteria bacterium]
MPHLLKRLELNGFKSFAAKTVLEFPTGITAIVGPNGSGKSNIVDAIRWLMGERDAKNLRGAKGEDLIFGGTPQKPRLGQAQASLHFENHNGFFPIDTTEVEISRVINRDGVSKYYINHSEVLLRELIDFFARARLGARGLVVVTQGNSDLFVQASSRERREMIEEVLGLREYQLKKSDAERKLKNSRVNLDQARALTEEILPHLRSLRRQTGRWERREVMQAELQELENRLFGGQLRELEIRKLSVTEQMAKHDARKPELAKKRQTAEAQLAAVEARAPEERKELQQIQAHTRRLFEERSRLQKEIGRLETQIEISKRTESPSDNALSLATAEQLLRKVQQELERALALEPNHLRETITELLSEVRAVFGSRQKQVETGKADMTLHRDLEAISGELAKLDQDLNGLRERSTALEQSQEAFHRDFKTAVTELEATKDALEAWESERNRIQLETERVMLHLEELERQIIQAGREVEEFRHIGPFETAASESTQVVESRIFRLRGELASIGEVDETVQKEAKETEERYRFLSQQISDLEAADTDLQVLIKDLREKILHEFHNALGRINHEFAHFFEIMFGGGTARLEIVRREIGGNAANAAESDASDGSQEAGAKRSDTSPAAEPEYEEGLDIIVKLPKRRISSLEMLSGGERSLVGIAALFALVSISPPPFLVLDEIDAPLDESNARRFAEMLKDFSKHTQFILVTHNRVTMESAEVLYGVTLAEDGTSKILSLKLEPVAKVGSQ